MDDLGDKINSILSDPGALDKIASMAKSIMGGGEAKAEQTPSEGGDFGIDPAMLGKLAALMQKSGGKSDKQALLTAMKPYLSEKRRRKMDKALKLAKLAAFAELAAAEFGVGEDGDV